MNRPSFSSPKPSPGFVYFQTGQSNPADTANFLAFSDNKQSAQQSNMKSFAPRSPMYQARSPMQHAFSPNFTSSPVHFKRGSNLRNNWNQNRRNTNQNYNRRSSSFNSTGSNRSFQNDSWNSSSSICSPHHQNRKRDSSGELKTDIEGYIHPSFFEDPWAGLVKKIEQSWAESDAQEESLSKLDIVDDSQSKNESGRSGSSSADSSEDDGDDSDSSTKSDK